MYSKCFGIFAVLFLSACGDDAPSAVDIEEGYRNLMDKNLARAITDYGLEDNVPPILLGMIKTTARIDSPRCEENCLTSAPLEQI